MLGIPLAAGTEAPFSSVMGKQRCRRIESTYPNCVTSTEQDKPISLPVEGRSTVRRIEGDAGIGIARKRMLPCNRADRLRSVKLLIVIVLRKKFSSVRTSSPMTSTLGVIAGRQRPVM